MKTIEGKTWVFGDEINTDVMAPGIYFKEPMEIAARHCLEAVNPNFAKEVMPGEIVVGGRNFGVGSAREQAAMAFRELKVGVILAASFARIFYRNAINLGVPAMFFPDAAAIQPGQTLRVDPLSGRVENLTAGTEHYAEPIPPHLVEMINAGGLMGSLKSRLSRP